MTPELQTRISAIKAECERVIELSEKATAGPWNAEITPSNDFVMAGPRYICTLATLSGRGDDFNFIAHSRNVSPAMARVVLWAIDQYERGEFNDAIATELANQFKQS